MIPKTLWASVPIASLLILSCSGDIGQTAGPPLDTTVAQRQDSQFSSANVYVDEETAALLDASLREGSVVTKSASLNDFLDELGVASAERLFPDTGRFEQRRREAGLHRWYRIRYSASIPETKAADAVSRFEGISVFEAERPIKMHEELPFDDPFLGRQWQYYNSGERYSRWRKGADINVLPVWKDYTTGDPDVIVAVVDGGIDVVHQDLAGVVSRDGSWNFCDNSRSITAEGHGTHVAGIIGAVNNNGIGVSGIAGGDAKAGIKGVTLLSCQIFSSSGKRGEGAEAIVWAADHGAVIVNNSWGYDFMNDDGSYDTMAARESHEFFEQPNEGPYRHSLKDAVDYFNKYAGLDENGNQEGPMAGGVVFFSAGNESIEYGAPACYPEALAVGAFGPTGQKAYYSNSGTWSDDWVDIAAPGGDYNNQGPILSTLPDDSYGEMQGTSMACPHVSGVASLIVSAVGGPGFTRQMLIDRLLGAPNPDIDLTNARIGIPIDAMGAVSFGAEPEIPAEVSTLSATAASNSITATWNVTESENHITAFAYRLFYGTDRDAVIASTAASMGEGVSSVVVETGSAETGEALSASIAVDFEKTYYLKVTGYDYGLNYSGDSNIASVTTPVNNPPVITPSMDISNLVLRAAQTLSLTIGVEDPDGHAFTVAYEPGSEADDIVGTTDAGYILQITAPDTVPGTYTGTFTATDSYGKTASLTIRYTVLENTPPVTVGNIQNILFPQLNVTKEIALSDYFKDEDGDELHYSFTNSAQGVVHITGGTNDTAFITSMGYGLAEIGITARDAAGGSCTITFKTLVRDGSRPVDIFPNPVKDSFTILPGESGELEYRMSGKAGAVVLSGRVPVSPFEPLVLDVKDLPAGTYYLYLKGAGLDGTYTIAKI